MTRKRKPPTDWARDAQAEQDWAILEMVRAMERGGGPNIKRTLELLEKAKREEAEAAQRTDGDPEAPK